MQMTKTVLPSSNSFLRVPEARKHDSSVPVVVSGVNPCVSFLFVVLSDAWLLLVSSVNVSVERIMTNDTENYTEKPCESS